jgi:1-hydroxycarotenoid 3,4-desaturase
LRAKRVIVIGAGMGGLAAAIDLARQGMDVEVIERAVSPGGKMREVAVSGALIDAGPTVFTMRWVFESLFADAGAHLADELQLQTMSVLARHAWRRGGRLDLFADVEQSAEAIGNFAGADDARGYREFCKRGQEIYETLRAPYIAEQRPSPLELIRRVGWQNLGAMWRTAPMRTLWSALGDYFRDPRLRQLFGRYATYVGSSPMLAPATLMLIAHVEQDGVWAVKGGMRRVADALQKLGERHGARFRFGAHVEEILLRNGAVTGVRLASGEQLDCDAIVFNGDVSALGGSLLGPAVASAAPVIAREARSLSAVTWCVHARTRGFNLHHHNVFFAEDYAAEFETIFNKRAIVSAPTVYVCAQDRRDEPLTAATARGDAERLLVLINAPADGDKDGLTNDEIASLARNAFGLMHDCGLDIESSSMQSVVTAPTGFDALFPATGGALYGRANHGSMASFARPGAASKIAGLYLAGGSVHPGPGIPMATLSGRLAAARLLADSAGSKRRY